MILFNTFDLTAKHLVFEGECSRAVAFSQSDCVFNLSSWESLPYEPLPVQLHPFGFVSRTAQQKSVGIIKFPTRPILAAPDEHYCEECAAGNGIRRTNALVLSAPRLVVA